MLKGGIIHPFWRGEMDLFFINWPSMKLLPQDAPFSDADLEAFLQEIELKDSSSSKEREQESRLPSTHYPLRSTEKKTFLKEWITLPLALAIGFTSGWFLKPTAPSTRSIEVIGEDILQVLRELKPTFSPLQMPSSPAKPPEPTYEIIEPLEGPDEFSVA